MNTNFTTIYLVRHAQSEGNALQIAQGHLDYPLTKEGEEQAKVLAQELSNVKFDAVFSSDLMRAKRTAEEVSLERGLEVTVTQLLRERRRGKFSGKLTKELQDELDKLVLHFNSLSREEQLKFKFDQEFESDEELTSRILTFLREIALGYKGKTVLVVSHGGAIRQVLIHLGFAPLGILQRGLLENTGYVKLLSNGTEFFITETKRLYLSSSQSQTE